MSPPMSRKLDGPVKLVRGEVVGVRLSREERLLVQFGQDTFGRHLLRFLLSGLGEKCAARRWLFIITFNSSARADVGRKLYGEPDDLRPEIETSLPYERTPLVILALMWLLIRHRGPPSARLIYEQLGQAESAEELSHAAPHHFCRRGPPPLVSQHPERRHVSCFK